MFGQFHLAVEHRLGMPLGIEFDDKIVAGRRQGRETGAQDQGGEKPPNGTRG